MSFTKWELLNKPTSKQEDWACSMDDGKKKIGLLILPVSRITRRQLLTMFVVFSCSCLPSKAWTSTTTLIKSASRLSTWETCSDYSHEVHVQDGTDFELCTPQAWTPTATIAELDNSQIIWETWFNGSHEAHVKTNIRYVERTAPQKWSWPADCTMHNRNDFVGQHSGCSSTPIDAKDSYKVVLDRHLTMTPSRQHLAGSSGSNDGAVGKCQCIGRSTTTSGNIVSTNSPPESALGASRTRYDRAHLRQHIACGGGNYDEEAGMCHTIGWLTTTSGNVVLPTATAARRNWLHYMIL